MIKKEDIKIGSILQIRKVDLEDITGSGFVEKIDPNNIYDSFTIKVVDMVGGWCEISCSERNESIDVDTDKLAKVSVFANESANKKTEQVSHPSHYAWLNDLCGVEPIEICQHFDFSVGNALKYLMRNGKVERNLTEKEQRIQDLEKAIYYIKNEIDLIKNDSNNKDNK
ncbi:DUF3310 domain-containing protein [Segatella copri]|uniref:DUF3310 domain-containing protein n=1 Tax=Segatella copri TaxID=165179 RepID=UPI001D179E87|nr:DUF3310 domain-containing protein [Segatella copri]